MAKTKIILKNSAVSQKAPIDTDLDYGELAINYFDGQLYYKSVDTTIKPLLVANELSSFSAVGLGLSYDSATQTFTLASSSASNADTVVYRDSTGSFSAVDITVENTLFANKINFDGNITDSATVTTNSTAPTVLSSLPINEFRTVKYTIQGVDNTNGNYQAIEILAIHDGVDVIATQYANLVINQLVANYDVIINNGNIELIVTSEVVDPTVYKVTYTATSV